MIATRRRIVFGSILALTVLCALSLMLASQPTPTQAAVTHLPVRSTPRPAPSSPGDHHSGDVLVSWIELHAQPARAGLWAVVQWRDGSGDWRDVDGWKGPIDSGVQSWGVFPSEFGHGPFRWILSDGGKVVGESAPFNLPSQPQETVTVRVSLTS